MGFRKAHLVIWSKNGIRFPVEPSDGNYDPESTLKPGRAFRKAAPGTPGPNLSHLYIDLDRFAENSISASTCAFENLNSK